MKVLVLHNMPDDSSTIAEQDVLIQCDAVVEALRVLQVDVHVMGCTLNLEAVRQCVLEYRPDAVVNLVESLAGTDRLMLLVPLLLDGLDAPYTGASSAAMFETANKVSAKARLRSAGLPTPDWETTAGENEPSMVSGESRWIIKPLWEHASRGIDDESVFLPRHRQQLRDKLIQTEQRVGCPMLAEKFVDGREFNLSILAGQVLPPAEIDFSAFPADKPRIVGHAAKWDEESFEYQQTPRRFDFTAADDRLLEELQELAVRCWHLFGLTGFARVDFRVDEAGRPWILEINVNPCLSPDAGFAAALSEAGIRFDEAVSRILNAALRSSDQMIYCT